MTNKISTNLDENIEYIKKKFHAGTNTDIIMREFRSGGGVRCFVASIDGMASSVNINDFIIIIFFISSIYW